jgi:hypothetical protein
MQSESLRLPYGEWPAHHAYIDEIALDWAILAVKGIDGDRAVLIANCPPGDHQGTYLCSADAAGYHWSFRGSVIDERAEQPGHVRIWIRSDGDITVTSIEPRPSEPVASGDPGTS